IITLRTEWWMWLATIAGAAWFLAIRYGGRPLRNATGPISIGVISLIYTVKYGYLWWHHLLMSGLAMLLFGLAALTYRKEKRLEDEEYRLQKQYSNHR
ncbi:hypothetical protein KEJ51_06895, partial [Candidatus Bathyarchaeota archaeon]|nr:hypothetical protein [Candidatus Bathyarchaeota archaeon]